MKFGRWPRAGASPGGAAIGVFDVNGDGLNDVVTSMEAHGFGLAWYEQKKDKASGAVTFVEHVIVDDFSAKNPGGVTFSEPHAMTFGDIDGDGIPDIVVGKRLYSHNESYNDPDPYGDAYAAVPIAGRRGARHADLGSFAASLVETGEAGGTACLTSVATAAYSEGTWKVPRKPLRRGPLLHVSPKPSPW